MRNIYQMLAMFVRTCYMTIENSQLWTLLHLSMMTGLPGVNDSHIMALCKYALYFRLIYL
jgi:hypothetical protein